MAEYPPRRDWTRGDRFGRRDRRGRIILDRAAADYLNGIAAELRRRSTLDGSDPIRVDDSPDGRVIAYERPDRFPARLNGLVSPYGWTAVFWGPSGWETIDSPTVGDDAVEANGVAGLGGSVQWLRWEPSSNDYRFQDIRSGTPCEGTSCFSVVGCGHNLFGATVTARQAGVEIASCVTDAAGYCCIALPSGVYEVTASVGTYTDQTQTVTVSHCTTYAIFALTPAQPQGQICILVLGCPRHSVQGDPPTTPDVANYLPLAGATVELRRGGSVIFTLLTGADGTVCFAPSDHDPFDLVITHPDFTYTPGLQCLGFPGGLGGVYNNPATVAADDCVTVTYPACMRVDPAFFCCGPHLVPHHLTLSNSDGSIDFDYMFMYGGGWFGCQTVTRTITVCDSYGFPHSATGDIKISWRGGCKLMPDGSVGWILYEAYSAQCNIQAPWSGGVPTYFWTFVPGDCPLSVGGINDTEANCQPPGQPFYTGGGAYVEVSSDAPESAIGTPFDVTINMPGTGPTYAPGVACPDPYNGGWPSPPLPVPVSGPVTIS